MPGDSQDRIALFIDFENLVTRTGVEAATFDLQPTLDKLLEKGKVVYRRAYADWHRFPEARRHLHDKGVELVEVPPSTRTGKNGADIRLVIDALELAYLREHISTFAIASGDSDFTPLVYKLRENARYVIGLAVRGSASPLFIKACDEFVYVTPPAPKKKAGTSTKADAEKEKATAKPAETAARKTTRSRTTTASTTSGARKTGTTRASTRSTKSSAEAEATTEKDKKTEPKATEAAPAPAAAEKPKRATRTRKTSASTAAAKKKEEAAAPVEEPKASPAASPRQRVAPAIPDVARSVTESMLSRATGRLNPSAIKEAIVRIQPDFDVRDHGFSTFSKLLEAMEKEQLLKREQTPSGQWYVVRPD